jgi:hypothetical protein
MYCRNVLMRNEQVDNISAIVVTGCNCVDVPACKYVRFVCDNNYRTNNWLVLPIRAWPADCVFLVSLQFRSGPGRRMV